MAESLASRLSDALDEYQGTNVWEEVIFKLVENIVEISDTCFVLVDDDDISTFTYIEATKMWECRDATPKERAIAVNRDGDT
jgi:hypothetical protein